MTLKLSPNPSLRLSPGVYLLPEHLTPSEVESTAQLLSALLPGELAVEPLDPGERVFDTSRSHTIGVFDDRWISQESSPSNSLVASTPSATELRALGYRYVLARISGLRDDSRWLERSLKPATVSSLRRVLQTEVGSTGDTSRAEAVLRRAATMTNDPAELILLLDRTLDRGPPGTWDEGLEREAGVRLAERLNRLGDDDRRAALPVVLSEGRGNTYDTSFRRGAEALARLGLGDYVHGDFAAGPLVREVAGSLDGRNEFLRELPGVAWSPRGVELLEASRDSREALPAYVAALGPVDVLVLSVLPLEHDALVRAAATRAIPERESGGSVLVDWGGAGHRSRGRMGIVPLPEMGGFVSNSAAKRLIAAFRPRLTVLCGICAGRRGFVELEDIVVADAVFRYDVRRSGVDREPAFETEQLYRMPSRLRKLVTRFDAGSKHRGRLHVGTLATGQEVLRESRVLERSAFLRRDVIGVEMESEGVLAVAGENALVVHGVADFADGSKADAHQGPAALAAAAWLMSFIDAEFEEAIASS